MPKLKIFTAIIISLIATYLSSAFAKAMMLEYDGSITQYNGEIYKLVVNNKIVEPALEPIIFNDRALVPVRDVFEEIGATVRYNNNTKDVEIIDNHTYVRMTINNNVAYVNGIKTSIPDSVVPKLISKVGGETKTMVPVRFISETIGLDIEFDGENGAILVESDGYTVPTSTPTPIPTPTPTIKPTETPTAVPTETPIQVLSVKNKMISSNKLEISVELNKKGEYSYFTLDNPERFVIDIKNAVFAGSEQTNYINQGGISAVRIGVNTERTRIVVDTENLVDYDVKDNGKNLTIYVQAKAASTPAPDKAPSSTASPVSPVASASPTPVPTPMIVNYDKNLITIDAGHGGYDPGAQGKLDGQTVNESDLNLQIAFKVKKILENNGFTVLMTRSDDTYKTLIERPQLANEKEAAIFVSIHINSVDNAPEASGTEVFYAESSNHDVGGVTSSVLAKNILNSMLENMGSVNRGVKTAEHAVTKRSYMPACLAEVGFITNENELTKMVDPTYQYSVAKGIAQGIMKTVNMME